MNVSPSSLAYDDWKYVDIVLVFYSHIILLVLNESVYTNIIYRSVIYFNRLISCMVQFSWNGHILYLSMYQNIFMYLLKNPYTLIDYHCCTTLELHSPCASKNVASIELCIRRKLITSISSRYEYFNYINTALWYVTSNNTVGPAVPA